MSLKVLSFSCNSSRKKYLNLYKIIKYQIINFIFTDVIIRMTPTAEQYPHCPMDIFPFSYILSVFSI